MRHIISIELQNEAGALTRVAGLFSNRGYNIESLHVAPTEDAAISRLTLVTTGSNDVIQQICNQLLKLVDVVALLDMTRSGHIERELLLLKMVLDGAPEEAFDDLMRENGARILDDRPSSYTLELTASGPRIDAFMERARTHGEVVTVVRSGIMALSRGTPLVG
ncbi:MAG: acetolactate synthase small subunit [Gammaproteobacteria bacterium]